MRWKQIGLEEGVRLYGDEIEAARTGSETGYIKLAVSLQLE